MAAKRSAISIAMSMVCSSGERPLSRQPELHIVPRRQTGSGPSGPCRNPGPAYAPRMTRELRRLLTLGGPAICLMVGAPAVLQTQTYGLRFGLWAAAYCA